MARLPLAWLLLGWLPLAGLPLGCSRAPERPRNLLLITVDTLRPDRLGVGGNERPTSPAIDRLAAEGITFSRTYSQAGWTLPSVATILTGRYPRDHGATSVHRRLNASLPTLAGILAENGYDTRAFVSHVMLTAASGLADGFAVFDNSVLDVGHPHRVSTAIPLTEAALASLGTATEPFFLWVHFFDPHFAYLRHSEWAEFGPRPIDRYDGEIAYTDRQIGRLMDELRRRELDRNTVVVFTADHGETFGERPGRFHFTHYEEVLRIPLIVRAPGLSPATRTDSAEQIDVMPTILSLLRLDPFPGLPGRDRSLAPEPSIQPAPPIFVERDRPPRFLQRTVIEGDLKLMLIEFDDDAGSSTGPGPGGLRTGSFFYNLDDDPGERVNLYDASDPRIVAMEGRLQRHFARPTAETTEVAVDDELQEQLESLGYLP